MGSILMALQYKPCGLGSTYAPSHLAQSTTQQQVLLLEKVKYSYLGLMFHPPIAIETSGVLGPLSLIFLRLCKGAMQPASIQVLY